MSPQRSQVGRPKVSPRMVSTGFGAAGGGDGAITGAGAAGVGVGVGDVGEAVGAGDPGPGVGIEVAGAVVPCWGLTKDAAAPCWGLTEATTLLRRSTVPVRSTRMRRTSSSSLWISA